MQVWRICRKRFVTDALSGKGGLFTSGRWHTKGRSIVYTSQSLALAALEVLVHVDRDLVPVDLVQIEIDIPDGLEISTVELKTLPKLWQSYPSPEALQHVGNDWIRAEATPILRVPSSIIASDSNYLVNPQHADASVIKVVSTHHFVYDRRLTK